MRYPPAAGASAKNRGFDVFGRALVLQVAVLAAALIAGVTGALAAVNASAPPPDLPSLVLTTTDFLPGAAVGSQSASKVTGGELYVRSFKPGVRVSDGPLIGVISIAILDADATTAATDYADLDGAARSKAGRLALAKSWATEFVKGYNVGLKGKKRMKVLQLAAGAPAEIGSAAFRLPITVKTNKGTVRLWFEVTQTDRAVAILELISPFNRALSTADATKALTAEQGHLQTAFTVANTAAPTISGTPVQGQVLTLDEGTWTGAPSTFTYAWSRCDAATGTVCAPIAGATTKTYTVTAADAGSKLVVTVTGANSVSNKPATSAPTAVVT
jgi:hypothetical protein